MLSKHLLPFLERHLRSQSLQLAAIVSPVGTVYCCFCFEILYLVLLLVFALTSNQNVNSWGTGTAFSLSFVNHDFTSSNYSDLCTRHINALLTGWTMAPEKKCSPEATGKTEGGLREGQTSSTGLSYFASGKEAPVPEEEILISGSMIFLCDPKKGSCFVLFQLVT